MWNIYKYFLNTLLDKIYSSKHIEMSCIEIVSWLYILYILYMREFKYMWYQIYKLIIVWTISNLFYVQPDQINMAVVFWYLVKSDLSSVRYSTRIHWTSHVLQRTRNTRPCITGHPVQHSPWTWYVRSFAYLNRLRLISAQSGPYQIWEKQCNDFNLFRCNKFLSCNIVRLFWIFSFISQFFVFRKQNKNRRGNFVCLICFKRAI